MRFSISDTAEYGETTRGPRIINEGTRAEMKKILDEIRDGSFVGEWMAGTGPPPTTSSGQGGRAPDREGGR